MPSEEVRNLIDAFLEEHGEQFRWGPGHITMDDGNVEDSNLHFCIKEINERIRQSEHGSEVYLGYMWRLRNVQCHNQDL